MHNDILQAQVIRYPDLQSRKNKILSNYCLPRQTSGLILLP